MAVDPGDIRPGYHVYAHRARSDPDDLGQYVGVVAGVLQRGGVHYLHVRGGIGNVDELFLPLGAVRAVGGDQVHLDLSPEDLAGQAWRQPPAG